MVRETRRQTPARFYRSPMEIAWDTRLNAGNDPDRQNEVFVCRRTNQVLPEIDIG